MSCNTTFLDTICRLNAFRLPLAGQARQGQVTNTPGHRNGCRAVVYFMYTRAKIAREKLGMWTWGLLGRGRGEYATSRAATRSVRVEEISVLQMHSGRAATNEQPTYFNQSNCLNTSFRSNSDLFKRMTRRELITSLSPLWTRYFSTTEQCQT